MSLKNLIDKIKSTSTEIAESKAFNNVRRTAKLFAVTDIKEAVSDAGSLAIGFADTAAFGYLPDKKLDAKLEELTGVPTNPVSKGTGSLLGFTVPFKAIGTGLKLAGAGVKSAGILKNALHLGTELGIYETLKQQEGGLPERLGSGIGGAITGTALGGTIGVAGKLLGKGARIAKRLSKAREAKIKKDYIFPETFEKLRTQLGISGEQFTKAISKASDGRVSKLTDLQPAEMQQVFNGMLNKASTKVQANIYNDLANRSAKNIVLQKAKLPAKPNIASRTIQKFKRADDSFVPLERMMQDLDGGRTGANSLIYEQIKQAKVRGYEASQNIQARYAQKHSKALQSMNDTLFTSKRAGEVVTKNNAMQAYVGSLEGGLYDETLFKTTRQLKRELRTIKLNRLIKNTKGVDPKIAEFIKASTDRAKASTQEIMKALKDSNIDKASLQKIMKQEFNNVHLEKMFRGNKYTKAEIVKMIDLVEKDPQLKALAMDAVKDRALLGRQAIIKHNQHSSTPIKKTVQNWLHIRNKEGIGLKEDSLIDNMFKFTSGETNIPTSFLKHRSGNLDKAVSMDFVGNLVKDVEGLSSYVYNVDTMKAAKTFIGNKHFKRAVTTRYGQGTMDAIRKHVDSVYDPAYEATNGVVDSAAKWLRTRVINTNLIGNMLSVTRQPISSLNTAARVGLPKVLAEQGKFISSPKGYINEVNKLSRFMKTRRFSKELLDRAKEKGVTDLLGKGKIDKAAESVLVAGDKLGAYPAWKAVYKKQLSKTGSIKEAVRFADKAIRQDHPLATIEDLALIQKGSALSKMLTTFANQPIKNYSILTRDLIGKTVKGKMGAVEFIRRAGYGLGMQALLMRQVSGGGSDIPVLLGDKPGERREVLKQIGKDVALYPAGFVPILGQVFSGAAKGFSATPAALGIFKDLDVLIKAKGIGTKAKKALKIGALLGNVKGATQAIRTSQGIYDIASGETSDLRRLITGKGALENQGLTKLRKKKEAAKKKRRSRLRKIIGVVP